MQEIPQQPRGRDPRTLPILLGFLLLFGVFVAVSLFILHPAPKKEAQVGNPLSDRLICDDSYLTTTSYEDKNPPFIDFRLHQGCFTGWITLPAAWQSWQTQFLQDQTKPWVMEWWDGWQNPISSVDNQHFPNIWSSTQVPAKRLRLQGSGMFRFYRTSMIHDQPDTPPITFEHAPVQTQVRTATPAQPPAQPMAEKTPQPPRTEIRRTTPMLNRQAAEGAQDEILISMEYCERVDPESIGCWAYVSNLAAKALRVTLYRIDVVDGKGNTFSLNSSGQEDLSTGRVTFNIPAGSRAKYVFKVPDKDQDVRTLTLYLDVSNPRELEYTFRDIPVAD